MLTIQDMMLSKIITAITTIAILTISLPSNAECKCNRGIVAQANMSQNQSSLEQWRTEIKRSYDIRNYPTPVTNQNANPEAWRNEIKRRYVIRNYPTPITDQFGGKNSAEWYRRLSYGRRTPVTDSYYRR